MRRTGKNYSLWLSFLGVLIVVVLLAANFGTPTQASESEEPKPSVTADDEGWLWSERPEASAGYWWSSRHGEATAQSGQEESQYLWAEEITVTSPLSSKKR